MTINNNNSLTTHCFYANICLKNNSFGGTKMMRKFSVEFTAKNLTGNAGLIHLGRFADKILASKNYEKMYHHQAKGIQPIIVSPMPS